MQISLIDFDSIMKRAFSFLEAAGWSTLPARRVGGEDPRDRYFAKLYSGSEIRLDICWSEVEQNLLIAVTYPAFEVPRSQRLMQFEPFIDMQTYGAEKVLVPYVRHGSRFSETTKVAVERSTLFESGIEPIAHRLAQKLKKYLGVMQAVSEADLIRFQKWMSV